MSSAKAKQAQEIVECQNSYPFEALQKFLDRHLVEGHDVRMFLDPNGNYYAIFCAVCDPRTGEAMETRH